MDTILIVAATQNRRRRFCAHITRQGHTVAHSTVAPTPAGMFRLVTRTTHYEVDVVVDNHTDPTAVEGIVDHWGNQPILFASGSDGLIEALYTAEQLTS